MNKMQSLITSDGVTLAFEVHSEQVDMARPTIIWCHGFTGSARNWRSTLRRLPEYRHVAYDLRGHARSSAPSSLADYSLARLGLDLIELVQHLQVVGPVHLVGLSLGAIIVFEASRKAPQLFEKLVFSSLPDPENANSLSKKAHKFAQAIRLKGLEAAGEEFVWGSSSGFSERDAVLVKQGFLEHPGHSLAHLLDGVLAALPSSELFAACLQAIELPALFLYGEQDSAARDYSKQIQLQLNSQEQPAGRFEFMEIQNGGHLLNLTSGETFAHAVACFLNTSIESK